MPSLPQPALCLVTDDALTDDRLQAISAAASAAGARWLQLRARNRSGAAHLVLAHRLRDVTSAAGAMLIVNDRIDVALAANADGVHLPSTGFPSARARRIVGATRLLGRSVHTLAEVAAERALGAVDYLQFGPVYATPSKSAYGAPQGLDRVAAAVRVAGSLPIIVVGGIDAARVDEVLALGVGGVAVISAVMRAPDSARATGELLAAIRRLEPRPRRHGE